MGFMVEMVAIHMQNQYKKVNPATIYLMKNFKLLKKLLKKRVCRNTYSLFIKGNYKVIDRLRKNKIYYKVINRDRRGVRMEQIKKIKQLFFNKQFIIFIVIGGVNTISSAIFSSFYSVLLGDVEAFIPGYATGILVSYVLNTLFTFKDQFELKKLIKFAMSTIPNFLIQFVTVYVGVNLLHINNIICYGIAAVIGVPITFAILKLFVYRNKAK